MLIYVKRYSHQSDVYVLWYWKLLIFQYIFIAQFSPHSNALCQWGVPAFISYRIIFFSFSKTFRAIKS